MAKSKISEFSYGFALTNEWLASLGSVSVAPVFPSLIEEGRTGGGYDVRLEKPGIAFFLQFKRSSALQLSTAREHVSHTLKLPFYRFKITAAKDSRQHDLLLRLDQDPAVVMYAAPLFHTVDQFNAHYAAGTVGTSSLYVRPRDIGRFADLQPHYGCFNDDGLHICSEPRPAKWFSASDLEALLATRLSEQAKPFGEGPLDEVLLAVEKAAEEAPELDLAVENVPVHPESAAAPLVDSDPVMAANRRMRIRPAEIDDAVEMPVTMIRRKLRRIADLSLHQINAQFFVVQPKG